MEDARRRSRCLLPDVMIFQTDRGNGNEIGLNVKFSVDFRGYQRMAKVPNGVENFFLKISTG